MADNQLGAGGSGVSGGQQHEPARGGAVSLDRLSEQLYRIEHQLSPLLSPAERAGRIAARDLELGVVPAWRRLTDGEERWPATVAVLAVITFQVLLPDQLTLTSAWVMPGIEAVILATLVTMNPRRIDRPSPVLRTLGLLLIAVASLANAWSMGQLVHGLVNGTAGESAGPLLASAANIWLTNVIIFALWYWELDRGGPVASAHAEDLEIDFLFPQMATPEVAPADWEPRFADYLYTSFTNATAFSPTDTMPLTRWAKMAMALQSAISLVTAALVIARAVNILR
ncbi:MAG: hypothetical protein ACXV2I_07715 [Actinomycetes bacterium]